MRSRRQYAIITVLLIGIITTGGMVAISKSGASETSAIGSTTIAFMTTSTTTITRLSTVISTTNSTMATASRQTSSELKCSVDSIFDTTLNGSLPSTGLSVLVLNSSARSVSSQANYRLNYTQVLASMNYSVSDLNNAYNNVIASPAFKVVTTGYIWAFMYWGPYVPGYTDKGPTTEFGPSNWYVPSNYKPEGAFFWFGLFDANGTAYASAYAAFLTGGSISVSFMPQAPVSCEYSVPANG